MSLLKHEVSALMLMHAAHCPCTARQPPPLPAPQVPLKEMVDAIRVFKGAEKTIGAHRELRVLRVGAVRLPRRRLRARQGGSAGHCSLPLCPSTVTDPLPAASLSLLSAEAGSWVRMKGGIYKHDLAKVIEADPSNQVSQSNFRQ